VCGYKFTSDSDDSIKGKYVFSSDGSIIGTAVSSLGNVLIIQVRVIQEQGASEEIRKYEIPLLEVKEVIGDSLILKSKKDYIELTYLKKNS
jgi:hypothetical protein